MSIRSRNLTVMASLVVLTIAAGSSILAEAPADSTARNYRLCGGLAGIPCPGALVCVDDPRDNCDPKTGGADCSGICVPPNQGVAEVDSGQCPADQLVADEFDFEETARPSCKKCSRDRRWCKCTYNGMPRASCDPCCYTNDIGILVCFD